MKKALYTFSYLALFAAAAAQTVWTLYAHATVVGNPQELSALQQEYATVSRQLADARQNRAEYSSLTALAQSPYLAAFTPISKPVILTAGVEQLAQR